MFINVRVIRGIIGLTTHDNRKLFFFFLNLSAVQNERDRITCRRPSYEDAVANGLTVGCLLSAENLSRQWLTHHEVNLMKIINVMTYNKNARYFECKS